MKETALCLALISSILLFTATLLQAAEQKIIFNTEKIEYKSGTSSKRCQDICSRRSGPDAKSLLSEGWKIVTSSPKEVIGEHYWYTPCNGCEPHGCTCIGTEYTLILHRFRDDRICSGYVFRAILCKRNSSVRSC